LNKKYLVIQRSSPPYNLPSEKTWEIRYCAEICDQLNVRVRLMPALQDLTTKSEEIDNLGLLSVINLNELPLDKWENKLFKMLFDKLFAGLFFAMIGWWLFPMIAILVKLDSKGPVYYQQERWGVNNKPIICYKFRTMVSSSIDIDEEGNYNQATKNDPRITAIGAFMRKTNMDELPQFWNVLIGNMSVVGPRPHPPQLNIQSMELVDNYMLRHMVIPGITGLAQVNGCRGETRTTEDMQKRVNFDLYYIQRWNFWLDLQIIIQTVINIFRGDQNAY
jgi:putative colanic acid biosynthesis UDP-glucose lipid carrier transferase